MLKKKTNGLFNQQRLGKTPTVIVTTKFILNNNAKILVIAPKTVQADWKKEFKKWIDTDACIVMGSKTQRLKLYNKHRVLIMNYEKVSIDLDILPIVDILIVDEAHRLKNFVGRISKSSPKFTKAIIKYSYRVPYKFALTGTPSSNKSYDVFPILHLLYPKLFKSYWNFIKYYYIVTSEEVTFKEHPLLTIEDFKEHKKEELQDFLDTTCIQRKRKDHMQWLPDVTIKYIDLTLDKRTQKWYNKLDTDWELPELEWDCPNKLTLITKERVLLSQYGPKIQFILDYINDYTNEQILIFSVYTKTLKKLKEIIPNSRIVCGETPSLLRNQIQQDFNQRKFPILLGNISVVKEGSTYEQANTMIIMEPSFTYSDEEQLKDRMVPTNKEVALAKEKSQILKLRVLNTIDTYVYDMLENKKTSTEIVTNYKTRKELKNEL